MGIPFYFRVIAREFPQILSDQSCKCTSFYVDFNGMVHQAAQRVIKRNTSSPDSIEADICDEAWSYLQETVSNISTPELTLVSICVDGVAPVAKMFQQRKRRYLSLKRWQLEKQTPVWDTNAITPGTAFMTHLQTRLRHHISLANAKDTNLHYELSAADEPGEGEHKIFRKIAETKQDGAVCIYGLDADLIMLSLMANRPGIFLMREQQESPNSYIYLQVDTLRAGILQHVSTKFNWPCSDNSNEVDIVESYLVLCFLLGNDFLPHLVSVSLRKDGHSRLLHAASVSMQTYGMVVRGGQIDMDCILNILKDLHNDESSVIMAINEEYMKKRHWGSSDSSSDGYPLHPDTKDMRTTNAVALAGQKWRQVYYKTCISGKLNDTTVVIQACKQFITGMMWTYAYYKRFPMDYQWYYPYGYAPTLLDLSNYLQVSKADFGDVWVSWKNQAVSFVSEDVQLLTVLPSQSIPIRLRHFVTNPVMGLSHMFPTQYDIKTYLFHKLWECVPVLPPIDIQLVKDMLAKHPPSGLSTS